MQLEINLDLFEFDEMGLQNLGESLTNGFGNDLYITIESSIANCLVDAHLFRGHYVQQILDVSLEVTTTNSDSLYNSIPVDTPYIEISQINIPLQKIYDLTFKFDASLLDYTFPFEIVELRTETNDVISDYYFSSETNSISLNSEYSGLIFADIIYHAFEWQIDYLSTLEPIALSFSGDFISRYTKYLDIEITFNLDGIPGYELKNLDTTLSEIVMT
ncbi:unnamed protein product, partial [marine sediment metagenome]